MAFGKSNRVASKASQPRARDSHAPVTGCGAATARPYARLSVSGCHTTPGFWGGKGSFQDSPLDSAGTVLVLRLAVPAGCSKLDRVQLLGCAGTRSNPSMNESWSKSLCYNTHPGTFSGPKKPLG